MAPTLRSRSTSSISQLASRVTRSHSAQQHSTLPTESSPSLGNSATRSFTIFPKLPIELRLVIWEFAVPCDRVVTIVKHGFPPEYFETEIVAHARVPAIFGVNQESRSVALKIYSLKINGENHELCPTLMDPVNDILVLPSFTITPDFFSKQSREMRAVFDILYAKLERLMLHPQHVIFDELQNSVEYEDPRSIYEDLDDPAHDFSWERLLKFRNLRFMGLMGHYEGRNENYARVGLDEFRVGAEARYQKVRGFWESESDGEDWTSARVPEYAMMDTQYWVSSMPISKLQDFLGTGLGKIMMLGVGPRFEPKNVVTMVHFPPTHLIPTPLPRLKYSYQESPWGLS